MKSATTKATQYLLLITSWKSRARLKHDTLLVLKALLRPLRRNPSVRLLKADFESGMRKALRLVFDNPHISGCAFHWGQTASNERDAVFKFCRKVFALPFLPAEDIPTAFEKLKGKVRTATFDEWITYISDRWISNTIWPISTWSDFVW
ncbi:hypothetical protein CHS0354_031529 [Potamilus streckersoni]|uniref:MULE transposase domain-containing protein n=1 Tax=Potamilus streckersoni TaxID=2493646 RepID=A0AAE0VVB2_9BIVA|nr:hypothetical protein CHS0354_031529 [Potamilus streckersoni]